MNTLTTFTLVALLRAPLAGLVRSVSAAESLPNMVFVMTDD